MTRTFPHQQQNATKDKPFFSVCYQYTNSPWTLHSHCHYSGNRGRTQRGTSDFDVAKAQALELVKQPGIALAKVFKTEDCYNHEEVFSAKSTA